MKQNVKYAVLGTLVAAVFVGGFALGMGAGKKREPIAAGPALAADAVEETTLGAKEPTIPEPSTEAVTVPAAPEGGNVYPAPVEEPALSKDVFTVRLRQKLDRPAEAVTLSAYLDDVWVAGVTYTHAHGALPDGVYHLTLDKEALGGKKKAEIVLKAAVVYGPEERVECQSGLSVYAEIGKSVPVAVTDVSGDVYLAISGF